MERYIAFSTMVEEFPSIGDIKLEGSSFEDEISAFMAISRCNDDPDFQSNEKKQILDYVLDTQNLILHYKDINGEYKVANTVPEYIERLLSDIRNSE